MYHGLTESEKLVNMLSEKAFLKLWTHPNPIGKKNKELCDCLIVCENNIIIISVKEIEYKDTGDTTGYERWIKHAIEKSAIQIWGAERWLNTVNSVIRHDGRIVTLPPKNKRIYYRISISLGSKEQIPIQWGDLGHGFVHVCDEKSVNILFEALNTITDFIEYLKVSEKLINNNTKLLFDGGGIEDLVALYLQNGYSLDFGTEQGKPDMMFISDDIWYGWSKSKEYKLMRNELKNSYFWDTLIEYYVKDLLSGGMFHAHNKEITDNDLALTIMALQPRRYRAVISDAFIEFLKKGNIASRVIEGYDNTMFVFLLGKSSDREFRAKELLLRCSIINCKYPDKIIVGIARDGLDGSSVGYSSDIVYMNNPNYTEKEKEEILKLQKELGYFSNI